MPHVVLIGRVSLPRVFASFPLFTQRTNDTIIRIVRKYLDSDASRILLEALVIETGEPQQLFALVNSREDGLVVRIHPQSNVRKTTGVKRLIAEIAKRIQGENPDLIVGKTNVASYLDRE